MSTWSVLAVERLGHPSPQWPSVYGPTAGADPVAANGLRTLDLTPSLEPLDTFTQQMERDLTKSSFASIKLDLADATGALADALGPFSATLATASRYYGPWIQVVETWTGGSALRFLGYVDESSIQWSEDDARTQLTVMHASQLLRERLITDFPELLRPWPSVPTNASQEFTQSTADALLAAVTGDFTPRSNAGALEAALWAAGQLSWKAATIEATTTRTILNPDGSSQTNSYTVTYAVPTAPASSVIIDGTAYAVDHLDWDSTIEGTLVVGDPATNGTVYTRHPVRIYLQGSPDLTVHLTLGATVAWGIPEARRTHYLLNGGAIAAPASGSDGVRQVRLNTVEQLVPGDTLTLTFTDSTSGAPRQATADLPRIIDLDGETGTVYLAQPVSQGYSNISKVRRNSQDPVLFDGLAYARRLVAPFTLDAAQFAPAPIDLPVVCWQPYDAANPALYGVHNLQVVDGTGKLRLARRGSDNGSGAYPAAGAWEGSWASGWTWLGLPTADATHQILGDPLQWPGAAAPYRAPAIFVEGDLSGGAATPPNGWRPAWRTWATLDKQIQDPESTWNGTAVVWTSTTATGDVPARLVAYTASTPAPGRLIRISSGTWTFEAHTGDGTLGSAATPTITGTLPTGNWLALGMGCWANGDEQEALLGLVATGSAYPFTDMTAVLLSQASGGALTVQQVQQLWASTDTLPAGPWALGGGLVVQATTETIDGLAYPRTRLHKLNGSTWSHVDLRTLEVLPQTLCPLLPTGATGARRVGGWYALALETFANDNYAAARRLRFLHLDADLNLVNGDPEMDPAVATDPTAWFSRGDLLASVVPDGSLLARMVRTSSTEDACAGMIGGRLFSVANRLPVTVERLKIGATAPAGNTLDVSHSGDGMTVADYLEQFAAAQLATAVPRADGSQALISRAAGTLRARTYLDGATTRAVGVKAAERGHLARTQAWEGWIRKVRITYADILADATATVETAGTFDGGRILELDMSALLASQTMARALGRAAIYWFGQPAPLLQETWTDLTPGTQGAMAPVFWADWVVGDLVPFTPYDPAAPTPVDVYKILSLKPKVEAREVSVELRKQPYPITPGVA